jgi:hypothetical protein
MSTSTLTCGCATASMMSNAPTAVLTAMVGASMRLERLENEIDAVLLRQVARLSKSLNQVVALFLPRDVRLPGARDDDGVGAAEALRHLHADGEFVEVLLLGTRQRQP